MKRFMANPRYEPGCVYFDEQRRTFDPEAAAEARAELRAWPDYAETPLYSADELGRQLGINTLWIKDEGQRQPLLSFKSLGGAFALGEALRKQLALETDTRPSYQALFRGEYGERLSSFRAVAATDGNHGRSLAWGARRFGVGCSIYLPFNVSAAREQAIADFGAETIRVSGNYDAAVAQARAEAEAHDWHFIQDTSFVGYTDTHRTIMHGYSLMAEEIADQLGDARPTHLFLQVGCGGMATTIMAYLWNRWGKLPLTILVQSTQADSLLRSYAAGHPVVVGGDHDTLMIGIACGEIAELAWPIFSPAAFGAVAIEDQAAIDAMRLCASGTGLGGAIVMGETGAAGLAVLLEASKDLELRSMLRLDGSSRVLLVNSEGETDPATYERIVGRSADDVRVSISAQPALT